MVITWSSIIKDIMVGETEVSCIEEIAIKERILKDFLGGFLTPEFIYLKILEEGLDINKIISYNTK